MAAKYLSSIGTLQAELSQSTFDHIKTTYTPQALATRIRATISDEDVASRVTSVFSKYRESMMQEKAIGYVISEMDPQKGIEHSLRILQTLSSDVTDIGQTFGILRWMQSSFNTEIKSEYFSKPPGQINNQRRMVLKDETSKLSKISNIKLRDQTLLVFDEFAKVEQASWAAEIASAREKLLNELSPKLKLLMPYYVTQALSADAQLLPLIGEQRLAILNSNITNRVLAVVDSELSKLDFRTLSGLRLKGDSEFIDTDPRFLLPQTAGMNNVPQNTITFRFSDNEVANSTFTITGQKLLSPVLHNALQTISIALTKEVDVMHNAIAFASPPPSVSRVQMFNDAVPSYVGDTPRPKESFAQFKERKLRVCRNNIIQVMLTRLLVQQVPPANERLQKRKQMTTALNVPFGAYVNIPKDEEVDPTVFEQAKQQAIEYLTTVVGYEGNLVLQVSENLTLPKSREAFVKVVNGLLINDAGNFELLDQNLVVQNPGEQKLGEQSHGKRKGNLTKVDEILGSEFKWRKADQKSGSQNFSPGQKRERMNQLLSEGVIYYDLLGYIGESKGSLAKRLDSSDLFTTKDAQYTWLYLRIGTYLTQNDKDDLLNLAAQSNSREDLEKEIYMRVARAEKMQNLVIEINVFIQQLIAEVSRDPQDFFKKAQVPIVLDQVKLTPSDWFSVIVTAVRGRFQDEDGNMKYYMVAEKNRVLSTHDLGRVLEYSKTMRLKS